jgi:hypothetical protein
MMLREKLEITPRQGFRRELCQVWVICRQIRIASMLSTNQSMTGDAAQIHGVESNVQTAEEKLIGT